jgi:hypothetical protein
MDYEIHIERLVLDGFTLTSAERLALSDALRTELAQLIAANGVAPTSAAHTLSPEVSIASPFAPDRAGSEIARAAYGALSTPNPRGGQP